MKPVHIRVVGDFRPYLRALGILGTLEGGAIAIVALFFQTIGQIGGFVLFALIGFAAIVGSGWVAHKGMA